MRGDGGLGEQRIRAELRALRLEVVLGHEEVVEAEPIGEDALAHLVDEHSLVRFVDLGEVPVVDDDPALGSHAGKVASAVVKDADLEHAWPPSAERDYRSTRFGLQASRGPR